MPVIPTIIIYIEIDCSPVKRNTFVSIGMYMPPAVVINPKDDTVTNTNTNNVTLPILTPNYLLRYDLN